MTIRSRVLAFAAVGGALALASSLTAAPAQADPTFTPDGNDVVGVGSDTTENVVDALARRYNATAIVGGRRLASFDATGSANIQPRQQGGSIPRPNGSSAGIDALQSTPSLSFARSSRGPRAGDEGTTFYPYAVDRLSYIVAKPDTNAGLSLNNAQLRAIYTCERRSWGEGTRIRAKVPQAGSGTRAFFLSTIGVTEAEIADAIAQRDNFCDVAEVQENDPAPVIGSPNAIAPFSFARFKTLPAGQKSQVRYAGNAPFEVSRDVYNVIRTANTGSLGQFFDESSWICTNADANQVIQAQGFTRLPAGQCGVAIPF